MKFNLKTISRALMMVAVFEAVFLSGMFIQGTIGSEARDFQDMLSVKVKKAVPEYVLQVPVEKTESKKPVYIIRTEAFTGE